MTTGRARPEPTLRPMTVEEAPDVHALAGKAFSELERRLMLQGPPPETEARRRAALKRITHLIGTDPGGAVVAEGSDGLEGAALALRRDAIWGLSLLVVDPAAQSRGTGSRLLARTLETARDVRGASHGPDLATMLEQGSALFVHPDRGFAMVLDGVRLLAALDAPAAQDLLRAAIAATPAGASAGVDWMTSTQPWAVPVVLDAGLELRPSGAVFTRGDVGPLSPYLPSGAWL